MTGSRSVHGGRLWRRAFLGLLAGVAAFVGLDARALQDAHTSADMQPAAVTVRVVPAPDPGEHAALPGEVLRRPLSFELKAGGVMTAEGSIDVGVARRFAAELAARGGDVRVLSLNSPGGSLEDAMAMARLVRERGIATEVADGALCASSCPLLFAGGLVRSAGEGSTIGLHQFYTVADGATGPAQAMADAQMTAARIQRHLAAMGVDPALWLHAFDTPPEALYHLSPDEMAGYRLVTPAPALAGG